MNETAITAGARAASVLIHAEHRPTTDQERADLAAILHSLSAAMRTVKDGSAYQAVTKVLRAHSVAGSTVLAGVKPERRRLLASRITTAFALEHLRSLAERRPASTTSTGGAL